MKAILEFSLPDEQTEHLIAVNAPEMYSVLAELKERTRGYLKHGHAFKSPESVMEWIREEICPVLSKIDS